MDAAYLRAAMPEPFTILGRKLRPFCLGHEILFQRFGNKFSLESKETPTVYDLLTGVFICSQPFGNDVSLDDFYIPWRVRWLARKNTIATAFNRFAEYIAAHSEIPEFSTEEAEQAGGKPYGTPTIQAVKVSLMSNLGLSEMDALNTQFSLAFWNHLAWAETQGSLRIVDEIERKRQAEEAALAESLAAKIDAIARKLFPQGYAAYEQTMRGSSGA
jgi:hypothetical protein